MVASFCKWSNIDALICLECGNIVVTISTRPKLFYDPGPVKALSLMMPPSSTLGMELKLQQRWEFRRKGNDSDSSSNNSKSSAGSESALKKHKLVSTLVSDNNAETSEASKFQLNGDCSVGVSSEINFGKVEKGKRGRRKPNNLGCSKVPKGPRKVTRRKRTAAYDHTALDDLKNYTNSLLEDLKVSRKDLLTWMGEEMQKLVAEEMASEPERREDGISGEKVKLRHSNNPEAQCQNNFGKKKRVQDQNDFEKCGKIQRQKKLTGNTNSQALTKFEQTNEVHQKNFQENVHLQRGNIFASCATAQNCTGGPSEVFGRSNMITNPNSYYPTFDDQVDYSNAIVPVTPTGKDKEERSVLSAKSLSNSSLSDRNAQQQQKSIVLGIRAQTFSGASSERSAKGRKATDSRNHREVSSSHPEVYDQHSFAQNIGSMMSSEKDKGEMSALLSEPFFSDSYSHQAASSMYLPLSTISTIPHAATHTFNNSLFNSVQPRVSGGQTGMTPVRSIPILGSSSYSGYFHGLQPEERSGSFAQMTSADFNFSNHNITMTQLLGSGFPVPLHQPSSGTFTMPSQIGFENLQRENSNAFGLSVNGGSIRFSGGTYSLPEQYRANNFHSHSSTYRTESRPISYQDGCQFQNYHNVE